MVFRHEAFTGSRVRGGSDGIVSEIGDFVRVGRATRQTDRNTHLRSPYLLIDKLYF